jgi:ADP-heptose:LPS heptosyltransferase
MAAPYAVLMPGAGAPVREWPVARLAELACRLAERHGLRIVLLGGKSDAALTARIAAALPSGVALDLAGSTSMDAVPDIVAGARLFVGMDSGLTHLAAGLGAPTVCVFSGAARREVWQPTGTRLSIVAGRTACSPCYLALPEQCPHAQACLTVITTDDVLAACEELLGAAG